MRGNIEDCESYKGCCDGPEWRNHLCPYHEGWTDGYDEGFEAHDEYVGKLMKDGSL